MALENKSIFTDDSFFDNFDYIFFDLDGTLTDPAEGITNSFIYALKFFGLEVPSYQKLCSFIGPPLIQTFKKEFALSDEKLLEAVKKYREYFAKKGLLENKVYPNIPPLLEKLKNKGKHLAVATSKPEEYSIKILEHFGLSAFFECICGSNMDESRSKKEEVIAYALEKMKITDKSRVIMVGDREYDIIGAKKNGLKSCGVLYGYGSLREFEIAGADFLLDL
ncbi:MAG: HAD family hydrolase [Treponema sp.]|nr:HAD family hydrolase [Treponema sp.]